MRINKSPFFVYSKNFPPFLQICKTHAYAWILQIVAIDSFDLTKGVRIDRI